jgi:DNA-binding NtrC family response regulator
MSVARILPFGDETPMPADTAQLEGALAMVNGVLAMTDDRDDTARWCEALRRLREAVPWRRAVIVGDAAWELRSRVADLLPLPADDPARELAAALTDDGHRWLDCVRPLPHAGELAGALVVRRGRVATVLEVGASRGVPNERAQELVSGAVGLMAALGWCTAPREAPPHGLVGDSPAMRALFEKLRLQADSHAAVYVYGETGTGKERVARALHDGSPRRTGRFYGVNASAVSDELFESEFFGAVRGAYTGAIRDREGYVDLARGGTLFIDEVADLSLRAQAKLLRFLENGEYRRVGDPQERRADVRIVTASNASLESLVAKGAFRDDLLHRVRILTLSLPPLREREGDIVRLGQHLLREAAQTERKTAPRIIESAWRALETYAWPGNVRELKAEMHRLVVEHAGALVRARELSRHITERRQPAAGTLEAASDAFQRQMIARVLAECRGRRTEAANRLGFTRQGLRLKMIRLGLA